MKVRWWEALLIVALACAQITCAPQPLPEPLPVAAVLSQERVARDNDRDACLDIQDCVAFRPYYRVGTDPGVGAVKWLISDQGHACVVSDQDFVLAVPGELFVCRSGWRFARPSLPPNLPHRQF